MISKNILADSSKFYQQTNWLVKFLDPKNQPQLIKKFLDNENKFLLEHIHQNKSVLDIGCGFGRHLSLLAPIINKGVGVDINERSISQSKIVLQKYEFINTFVSDASNLKSKIKDNTFDYVICMNNTFGNLGDKKRLILKEMKRIVKDNGEIIISVYSHQSISERVKWYQKTGLRNITIYSDFITALSPQQEIKEKFKSEHFTKKSLQKLFIKENLSFKIKELDKISYICLLSK